MNAQSWIVLGVVISILIIAVIVARKNRKKGCSCCNKDCPYKKK